MGRKKRKDTPWNKGKQFSKDTRLKMSKARIGVEPANKENVDINRLYNLYVVQKKNGSEVAKIMGLSIDVIKNRLRGQTWVRTTKQSCSSASFKDRMHQLQIKRLSFLSKTGRNRINKLEKRLYNGFEKHKLNYYPQYPMYGRFVVDAYLPESGIVIEVFGRYWHNLPKIHKNDLSKKKLT